MSQIEKLIEKIMRSRADVRFSDLIRILIYYDYQKIRTKGSHVHFRKEGSPSITFPVHGGVVRNVYVKEIIKLLNL